MALGAGGDAGAVSGHGILGCQARAATVTNQCDLAGAGRWRSILRGTAVVTGDGVVAGELAGAAQPGDQDGQGGQGCQALIGME